MRKAWSATTAPSADQNAEAARVKTLMDRLAAQGFVILDLNDTPAWAALHQAYRPTGRSDAHSRPPTIEVEPRD